MGQVADRARVAVLAAAALPGPSSEALVEAPGPGRQWRSLRGKAGVSPLARAAEACLPLAPAVAGVLEVEPVAGVSSSDFLHCGFAEESGRSEQKHSYEQAEND